jgi:hypothetical protein
MSGELTTELLSPTAAADGSTNGSSNWRSLPAHRRCCRRCQRLPSADVLVVFAITALLYIDTTVSVPSLYGYVERVVAAAHRPAGGHGGAGVQPPPALETRTVYGVAACIDSFCGIFFFPLYGYLADRYPPKRIFLGSFVIMAVGGVIYGLPGNGACGRSGPYLLVVGRLLIGSTSGLRAVGNSFIANYSPVGRHNIDSFLRAQRVCGSGMVGWDLSFRRVCARCDTQDGVAVVAVAAHRESGHRADDHAGVHAGGAGAESADGLAAPLWAGCVLASPARPAFTPLLQHD